MSHIILKNLELEKEASILEISCQNVYPLRSLKLNNHIRLDISKNYTSHEKYKHNKERFLFDSEFNTLEPQDIVVCLDVLIHINSLEDYLYLIHFLVSHTKLRLIVSGYTSKPDMIPNQHFHYYESIIDTLTKTNQFKSILKIESHNKITMIVAEKHEGDRWLKDFLTANIPKKNLNNIKKIPLFIHAGLPKTGTSALQDYFFTKRSFLQENNIFYPIPKNNLTRHGELLKLFRNGNLSEIKQYIDSLIRDIPNNSKKILLSEEGITSKAIYFFSGFKRIISVVDSIFSIYIIIFLRPQSDFIDSLYRQHLNTSPSNGPEPNANISIESFIINNKRSKYLLDYKSIADSWSKLLGGTDKVKIFPYSRKGQEDFFIFLFEKPLEIQLKNVNISLSPILVELLNHFNKHLTPNIFRKCFINEIGNLDFSKYRSISSFLTEKQQNQITEHYKESNLYIEKIYGLEPGFLSKNQRQCTNYTPFTDKELSEVLFDFSCYLLLELEKNQIALNEIYNSKKWQIIRAFSTLKLIINLIKIPVQHTIIALIHLFKNTLNKLG